MPRLTGTLDDLPLAGKSQACYNQTPMISVEEATKIVLENVGPLDAETVRLLDLPGRVLAEDISADINIPPFDNSAMDGYAVRAEDTAGASRENPRTLRVLEDLPAGTVASQSVQPGTAIRIMTGAPMPDGADAVIMVEHTEQMDDGVKVLQEVKVGENVRPVGEDVKQGEVVLHKGTRLRPAEIGMLASVGRDSAQVYRRPQVAVITTGTEVVEPSEPLEPGKIRNSNRYSLASQVLHYGAEIHRLLHVQDEPEAVEAALQECSGADVFITSGGVSVGDYDLVKQALDKLGEIYFWRVAIKPGKPTVFGQIQGKPLFGLPGYPVSSMLTFELFVRPALLKMMGMTDLELPQVTAQLTADLRHKPGRREFVRARTYWQDNKYLVDPIPLHGSGILKSMVLANSLIPIPEESTGLKAGEQVIVLLLQS